MLRLVSNKAKFPEHLVISRFCQCCYNIPRNLVSYTSTPKTVMNTQNMPGREIDLLETKDTRFRLPGSVGIFVNETWLNKLRQFDDATNVKKSTVLTNDELLKNLNDDKPMLNTSTIEEEEKENLQCIAHECPTLLIKDFQELFPRNRANILNGLTVLTISQKSQNDMSVWSIQVNIEREKLIAKYVSIAEKMCNFLKENGYWADFIDPSSGRLFDGEYTPATFFETDERYRNFGFEIEDLGCCKVISHKKWGTNAYVGALFTNAPASCDAVESLLIYMD